MGLKIGIIYLLTLFLAGSAAAQTPTDDTLVFVSDTQAPLFAEKIIHRIGNNELATKLIFEDIRKSSTGSVFLLGDLVAAGSKPGRWYEVDRFLAQLRAKGVGVWACMGNHEYIYNARSGTVAFQKRFPEHSSTGYFVLRDSVAIILLNSNFSQLSLEQIKLQQRFYDSTIHELDKSDAVKAIIVACHHSPYSNSKVVGSNRVVQDRFVDIFLKATKTKLFLSGHSHNFEHFRKNGKSFMVIGGGGGIHQNLNTSATRLVCENDDCRPLFHYLKVKRDREQLVLIIREVTPEMNFNNVLNLRI